MHDRRLEDREVTLGVSGKLIDGNLVMYDRDTDSLFLQASGEGLEGSLEGEKLQELAEESWGLVPWGQWRTEHPDTLVLTCAHCEGRGEATGTIDELDAPAISTDGR